MEVTNWSIESEKLLPAIETLDLVPGISGIGTSQFIRLDLQKSRVRMSGTSDVCGEVFVTGAGRWPFEKKPYYVDRRLFFPFVQISRQIKSKAPFEFSASEGRLVVRHGRRKAFFDTIPEVAGYAVAPNGGAGTVLNFDPKLFSAIRCAYTCSTPDPSQPFLNCVYLQPRKEGIDILAFNTVLAYRGVPVVPPVLKKALPFPLYLVALLGKEGMKRVIWHEREIELEFETGRIWQTISVPASKDFPVKKLYSMLAVRSEQNVPEVFRLECAQLWTLVSRLATYLTAVRKQDWVLAITGKAGSDELTLEAKVPQGQFRERMKSSIQLKSDVSVEWPLEYLIPVVEFLAKEKGSHVAVHYGTITVEDIDLKTNKKVMVTKPSPYYLRTKQVNLMVGRLVKGQ